MKFCFAIWYRLKFYWLSLLGTAALSIMFLAPSAILFLIEFFFYMVSGPATGLAYWSMIPSSFICEVIDWIDTSASPFSWISSGLIPSDSCLKVWIKYWRRLYIWGFYFLSSLIETASGIVSIMPPVGHVAIMLNGLSHSWSLCVSKIVLNFLMSWDANCS